MFWEAYILVSIGYQIGQSGAAYLILSFLIVKLHVEFIESKKHSGYVDINISATIWYHIIMVDSYEVGLGHWIGIWMVMICNYRGLGDVYL